MVKIWRWIQTVYQTIKQENVHYIDFCVVKETRKEVYKFKRDKGWSEWLGEYKKISIGMHKKIKKRFGNMRSFHENFMSYLKLYRKVVPVVPR
jgi:hypothetical protein